MINTDSFSVRKHCHRKLCSLTSSFMILNPLFLWWKWWGAKNWYRTLLEWGHEMLFQVFFRKEKVIPPLKVNYDHVCLSFLLFAVSAPLSSQTQHETLVLNLSVLPIFIHFSPEITYPYRSWKVFSLPYNLFNWFCWNSVWEALLYIAEEFRFSEVSTNNEL